MTASFINQTTLFINNHLFPLTNMPRIRSLNPNASEYNPIAPGIYPNPHASLIFSRAPPSPTPHHHLVLPHPTSSVVGLPAPPYYPTQIVTYITPTPLTHQQQYPGYYVTPPNLIDATNSPLPSAGVLEPQPRVVVQTRDSGVGGNLGRGRGCRTGRGRGRGIESFRAVSERNGRRPSDLRFERRASYQTRNGGGGGRREDNYRHKVMPLNRDDEDKTTVMIKNIPYDCPRQELIELLDEFCMSENRKAWSKGSARKGVGGDDSCAYDFLYLPIDFKTNRSRGYAFVNFTNAKAVWKFVDAYHLRKWGFVEWREWPKKIEIVSAKIQGKDALVAHFSGSVFECESNEFLPVCFQPARNGPGQPSLQKVVGKRRGGSGPIPHREGNAAIIRPKA